MFLGCGVGEWQPARGELGSGVDARHRRGWTRTRSEGRRCPDSGPSGWVGGEVLLASRLAVGLGFILDAPVSLGCRGSGLDPAQVQGLQKVNFSLAGYEFLGCPGIDSPPVGAWQPLNLPPPPKKRALEGLVKSSETFSVVLFGVEPRDPGFLEGF